MATRFQGVGIEASYNVTQTTVTLPIAPNPIISLGLDKFDLVSETWTQLSSMNVARCGFSLVSLGDFLYAIGGTDGAKAHNTIEQYSILNDTWTYKSQMPTPRVFFMCVLVESYIYCIGGLTVASNGQTSVTPQVDRYDTINDIWQTMTPLPSEYAVMMGVAHYFNGNIYVLSGQKNDINTYLDVVLTYNITSDIWTIGEPLTDLEINTYRRTLPFSFLDEGYIWVLDGLYYNKPNPITDSNGNIISTPDPIIQYVPDAYKYEISTGLIDRAEDGFIQIPRARYSGATTNIGNTYYFIGGVGETSNTLRFFESLNLGVYPFIYDDFARLQRGKSSFGAASYSGDYEQAIFIAGGVTSNQNQNFLQVNVQAIPEQVRLDGKTTCNISINIQDENNEYPEMVKVRLTSTGEDNDIILFTSDEIEVYNGHAIATLIPRSDDGSGTIIMQDNINRNYVVTISGSVIDSFYYGDTISNTLPTVNTNNAEVVSSGNPKAEISLPPQYKTVTFDTVVSPTQASQGSFFSSGLTNIGFLSLTPLLNSGGQSTQVEYFSDIAWLPQIVDVLNSNDGTFDDIKENLDRISRELPFGGSPLIDSISDACNNMSFDVTGVNKIIYVLTDGQENCSDNTSAQVLSQLNALDGIGKTPVLSSLFSVIPSDLYLSQGIREGSVLMETLAQQTNSSALYVTSDININEEIEALLGAKGFIGIGTYSCQIDLGTDTAIKSIKLNFDISDYNTYAYWQYSIGDVNHIFTLFTDKIESNETVSLDDTHGQFIRFNVEFGATLNWNEYFANKIVPPSLISIEIQYDVLTESYIYFKPTKNIESDVSQVVITLDAIRPSGSEINLGVNDKITGSWDDYNSPSAPAIENSSRVIIPLRRSLDSNTYTLESLNSVDGFIFNTTYGKWSNDATVIVYKDGTTIVPADEYKTIPQKGRVVFSYYTQDSYVISIQNVPNLSVAAKIVNRVHGKPIQISGAGYMYSTTKLLPGQNSSILPDATNLMITPLQPDVTSVFVGNYIYTDLLGRSEQTAVNGGTLISWFVNNVVQTDLANLIQWDNKTYNIVKSGDVIYFTVQPATNVSGALIFGTTVRSLSVSVSS